MDDYHARRALGVETLPNGETQGRDPRRLSLKSLKEIGHEPIPVLKAIRAKCLDCSHTVSEVSRCTSVDCALWPFRMGKNPFRTPPSDEARAAAAERLRKTREAA